MTLPLALEALQTVLLKVCGGIGHSVTELDVKNRWLYRAVLLCYHLSIRHV